MIVIDGSALQIVAGLLLLAGLFVLREFASGALRHAGEDFWDRLRSCSAPKKSEPPDATETSASCLTADADRHPETSPMRLDPISAPDAPTLVQEADTETPLGKPPKLLQSVSEKPRKTA